MQFPYFRYINQRTILMNSHLFPSLCEKRANRLVIQTVHSPYMVSVTLLF